MYLDISEPDNIWVKNPQLRLLKKATRLYETEGEKWFNRVYHAIYMVYDPLSPFRKTTTDEVELRREIKQSYFAEDEYSRMNWQKLKGVAAEFKEKSITKEAKLFAELEKVLKEDIQFVKDFSPEGIKDIGVRREAMKHVKDAWKDYTDAKREAENANTQSGSKYGSTHSNLALGGDQ